MVLNTARSDLASNENMITIESPLSTANSPDRKNPSAALIQRILRDSPHVIRGSPSIPLSNTCERGDCVGSSKVLEYENFKGH